MTTPENTSQNMPESSNTQLASMLENDADNVLDEAKTHWLLGEWEKLVELETQSFTDHPKRDRLVLLIAAAHQQLGKQEQAKKYVRLALEWGCPNKLVAQVLIAGIHNNLGKVAALNYNGEKSEYHFAASILPVFGKNKKAVYNRIRNELMDLNIIEKYDDIQRSEFFDLSKILKNKSTDNTSSKSSFSILSNTTDSYIKSPYAHNRNLTSELTIKIKNFVTQKLGKETIKPSYIEYLALKASEIERNSVGRLATTIQDAVLRQIVAETVKDEHLGVLEIGALYGINLAILYNYCFSYFDSIKVICLDPFDGYYGQPIDTLLGLPVTDRLFHRNMQLSSVPKDAYSLIKNYSTDQTALEQAAKEKITLLIIDGDHSYEGIKYDYENYFPLLESGGYVIIDDYNAKEWPGVQKFVDETVKNDPSCEFIGSFSRTAIGRKR